MACQLLHNPKMFYPFDKVTGEPNDLLTANGILMPKQDQQNTYQHAYFTLSRYVRMLRCQNDIIQVIKTAGNKIQ
jgi:hypothetical protein